MLDSRFTNRSKHAFIHEMSIPAEISVLESRLSEARIPLSRVFTKAEIDRSTWSRWRAGSVDPTMGNWRAVQEAVDNLIADASAALAASAPKTSLPDSTAGHGDQSSPDPIPDIERSPPLGGRPEQSAGTARGDIAFSSSSPRSTAPAGADQDS
jgi:hypothetical protein